jgi:hypothetical protein
MVPTGVGMISASSIGVWAASSYLLMLAVALVLLETRNSELEIHV